MSHPPAFSFTPVDLAVEAGGRGFRVDGLSVPLHGGAQGVRNWQILKTSFGLRVGLLWGPGSSPGERIPHLEEAGGPSEGGGLPNMGGALTWGR